MEDQKLQEAYKLVFDDILESGISWFKGGFDFSSDDERARESTLHFAFGLQTVMEFIANRTGHEEDIEAQDKIQERTWDLYMNGLLNSNIKSCPFCGSKPELDITNKYYTVYCNCGYDLQTSSRFKKIAEWKWNHGRF